MRRCTLQKSLCRLSIKAVTRCSVLVVRVSVGMCVCVREVSGCSNVLLRFDTFISKFPKL